MSKTFPPPYSLQPSTGYESDIALDSTETLHDMSKLFEAPRVKDYDLTMRPTRQKECCRFWKKRIDTVWIYRSICIDNLRQNSTPLVSNLRVEPKTYFANERTLFRWLNISLIIGSRSLRLHLTVLGLIAVSVGVNLQAQTTDVTISFGGLLGVMMFSCAFSLACLALYEYRSAKLHEKSLGGFYSDPYMPTIMALFIAAGLILGTPGWVLRYLFPFLIQNLTSSFTSSWSFLPFVVLMVLKALFCSSKCRA